MLASRLLASYWRFQCHRFLLLGYLPNMMMS
jgi:hypothetical protein